jgi:hypothetical protein
VVNATSQLLYCQERDPVPIVQEAGWVPGPVWTSAEKITPSKIPSPDCPAHSELLYQLRYLCYLVHSTNFEALQSAPSTSILLVLHVYCKIRQNIITYINGQLLLSSRMNTCIHTKTHNHQYFLRSKIYGIPQLKHDEQTYTEI